MGSGQKFSQRFLFLRQSTQTKIEKILQFTERYRYFLVSVQTAAKERQYKAYLQFWLFAVIVILKFSKTWKETIVLKRIQKSHVNCA